MPDTCRNCCWSINSPPAGSAGGSSKKPLIKCTPAFPKRGVCMLTTQRVWKMKSRHMRSIFFSVKQGPTVCCQLNFKYFRFSIFKKCLGLDLHTWSLPVPLNTTGHMYNARMFIDTYGTYRHRIVHITSHRAYLSQWVTGGKNPKTGPLQMDSVFLKSIFLYK